MGRPYWAFEYRYTPRNNWEFFFRQALHTKNLGLTKKILALVIYRSQRRDPHFPLNLLLLQL